ncbi:MAG: cob(I)yrinic acid a,c-diamide adenosyltransferase [Deltaproteobacteria bacterium]|nr:cob(I)yrinic acid a,c-diamide adenosyltransferase [Deltaproteobacteria bacterium]MBW2602136.1 cob(I)yrinic acid a,c-diamide adenosyltransferase [Deltaproteobacteria bacterium]
MGLKKGLVQVYTGDGKGKTTAALGLALRAIGRGLKVVMIQFLKGGNRTGELVAARRLWPELEIKPMGKEGFIGPDGPSTQDQELAGAALVEAKMLLANRACDVLILDEINVAVSLGLLSEDAVLDIIKDKPEDVELILTGRGACSSILERADLVTTMVCTRHYFDKGQPARIGIEH